MEALRLENVWKVYRMGSVEVEALRGVSLKIERGEFVAIMGPSGSGKSTLMNIMGLLDTPTRGRVYLMGRDVSRLGEDELAEIRGKTVGFVFQRFNLLPYLTALENVLLPTLFLGEKREDRARELLEAVGLGHRMHHLPSQLSGGEQQRVAIARALINEPEIILADEPTGNLDSKTGKQIMEIFAELHKKSKTLILVTHDEEVAGYAERVVRIRDGRILSPGEH